MVTKWKTHLKELERLRGQSGILAYDRAKHAVALFDDEEYWEALSIDQDATLPILDGLLEDLCLDFNEIRALLEAFPDRAEWESGKLRTMYDEAQERLRSSVAAEESGNGRKAPERIKRSEYEAMERKAKDALSQLAYRETEIDRLKRENNELRSDLEESQRTIARQEGRILEMERMLNLQPQAA